MLTSQLFWRIFAVYAGLTVCSAFAFALILSGRHRASVMSQVEHRLRDTAEIVHETRLKHSNSSEDVAQPSVQLTGVDALRVKFVPITVLQEKTTEILRADREESAFFERIDDQTGQPTLFFVMKVPASKSTTEGYIISSLPMQGIQHELQSITRKAWETAGLVSLFVLGVTYLVVSRIIRPLEILTQAAIKLTTGELPPEITDHSKNEIGTLSRVFQSMSRELSSRIQELQHQSHQREQNADQLATVLKSMVEGVVAVDGQEKVLLANDAAIRLLDLKPQSIVDRPLWESVRHSEIQQIVRETLSTGHMVRGEFDVPRTQSVVQVVATRLPASPTPGVLLVLHDITELRRLENMRREFVSNVSHELKTPLTSISAYAETLRDGAIDDEETSKFFLNRIEEQADRLHSLILDLIDIARMEQGSVAFDSVPIPLYPIVESSVSAHQTVADSKQIQLTLEAKSTSITVVADDDGLRTILDNLLDNALNYTPSEGNVTVRLGTEDDGQWAVLEVQDTGVGIGREHQSRIFERFYRVDKARSRELGGTGLGLSIVKHLCQVFGGTIQVTSQLGQGSTFTVRLPLKLESPVGLLSTQEIAIPAE